MEESRLRELKRTAARIRMDIVEETHAAKSGHPGRIALDRGRDDLPLF